MATFLFGLVGTFVLLAQAYAESQPLLLLVMPIPVATAMIVLVVAHDRRLANA